jgi:uncharacterized protein YfdQ (DUF2303 family)
MNLNPRNGLPEDITVTAIATMAQEACVHQIINVPAPASAEGLPEKVTALFDVKNQKAISLKPFLEEFRVMPARRAGMAKVETLASFIDLTNRHKDEHSAIFGKAAWPNPSLTAVIDYYTTDRLPRWGQHRVSYEFPLTDEFKAWIANNGEAMQQLDFALFLEDHAAELAAPLDAEKTEYEALFKERFATPAELIGLSRHLEVFVGASIKRQERLSNGERTIEFNVEHKTSDGNKVDVPGLFMVAVPAFIDGDPVRIPARLRYRVGGGDVTWFYQLYRWEFWLRTQVQHDLRTASEMTGLPAFEGTPEM